MYRTIGYSVLTQLLASGGNFVVALLILRFLPLASFGQYAYLFVIVGFCQAISNATAGYVYHTQKPRMALLRRHYERLFDAFNLAVIIATTLAGALIWQLSTKSFPDPATLQAATIFIAGAVASEALKLQAAANDRHDLVFYCEAVRQVVLVVLILVLGWRGASLGAILTIHGATGIAAGLALTMSIGWRPSLRRMGWLLRRHYSQARFLVPSAIIAAFHSGVVTMWAATRLGPGAVGLIRAGDLPFSALTPLRSSMTYFLPGIFHSLHAKQDQASRRQFRRRTALAGLLLVAASVSIWLVSILLFPLLTGKEYPRAIGFACAVASTGFFALHALNMYLSVIGRSDLVFKESIVGAVAAMGLFPLLVGSLGALAAAIAIAGSTLSMVIFAAIVLCTEARAQRKAKAES